jgi:hypothetical protein
MKMSRTTRALISVSPGFAGYKNGQQATTRFKVAPSICRKGLTLTPASRRRKYLSCAHPVRGQGMRSNPSPSYSTRADRMFFGAVSQWATKCPISQIHQRMSGEAPSVSAGALALTLSRRFAANTLPYLRNSALSQRDLGSSQRDPHRSSIAAPRFFVF